MSANQSHSNERLRSPRSILRSPVKPQLQNTCNTNRRLYSTTVSQCPNVDNPELRPRSVIGVETSLTDADTSQRSARTRHSFADLRTLIDNGYAIKPTGSLSKSESLLSGFSATLEREGRQVEEVDSGLRDDPWCQYKSIIQKKKHRIFEEHTNWLNNIFMTKMHEPITDLCRSIGDGVTLINLVQILTNCQVAGVCREPVQQSERVDNLEKCLHHLSLHDVDTQGLAGCDLADGNLKSTLILMNNLRKKYEGYQAYPPRNSTGMYAKREGSRTNCAASQWYNGKLGSVSVQSAVDLSGTPHSSSQSYAEMKDTPHSSSQSYAEMKDTPHSSSQSYAEMKDTPHSSVQSSASHQFNVAASEAAMTRNNTSSAHRITPQSLTGQSLGLSSHKQDTQLNNSENCQPDMHLIPGVIADKAAPAKPPLPQDIIREHDGTELIIPPKPRQSQQVAAASNKMAYVPSHPSERPNCVPRLPAQMPNSSSHVSAQQSSQRVSGECSSQQPPMYNPPPQYTRTYMQKLSVGDRNVKSGQGHPHQTVQSASSSISLHEMCNSSVNYPNTNRSNDQRNKDYASGQHPQVTPSPAYRNNRPSPHSIQMSVATPTITVHRAVPANGRTSPQGQSSTPASQSPNHDRMLAEKCSQQNYINVDHMTNTIRYVSQKPVHSHHDNFHDADMKNTSNAFICGQIPPSSVYPTNGTSMDRAVCIDLPEEQLPQNRAWTKSLPAQHGQRTRMVSATTLQDDVEALYSVVKKHRQQKTDLPNVQNKSDANKLSVNNKQEMVADKLFHSPKRSTNQTIPLPDADDWNSDDSSVTPPLPPLSPSNSATPPGSPAKLQQHGHTVLEKHIMGHHKSRRSGSSARSYETGWRRSGPGRAAYRTHARMRIPISRNINDVDSVDQCSTSNLSDGEEWEDVISTGEVHKLRQQMEGLEMMYREILNMLGLDKEYIPGSRRSVSSLSSVGRGTRRSRSNAFSHRASREIRNMNKRFNRLEAHVVTLARSVAQLSSEMYKQNTLHDELEDIRRELKQLKKERHQYQPPEGTNSPGTGLMAGLLSAGQADSRRVTEFEKFRGWIPSITNPKRVKKLAKFFGEDRLLQYFLEKLGYQKYIKNFRAEEITILELPYMSEERLEKLGIPMGPRQRILQEAQMCFRQENFNIYIV